MVTGTRAGKIILFTQVGNRQLIASPDNGLIFSRLPLSIERAVLQLLPPLRGNVHIPLIRCFLDMCCLEYVLRTDLKYNLF